jgi:hypothetical protein
MKMEGENWTVPNVVSFMENNYGEVGPVFSSNGKILFFTMKDDIWYVKKQMGNWSRPQKIALDNNADFREKICSCTNNNNIYFSRYQPKQNDYRKIYFYCSKMIGNRFTRPKKLKGEINSDNHMILAIYVSPCDSYMVVEKMIDSRTSKLYACFKSRDDTWTRLKKIPVVDWGCFPSISPNGKFLFFMTRDGIYWVDAKIIEELKPNELN